MLCRNDKLKDYFSFGALFFQRAGDQVHNSICTDMFRVKEFSAMMILWK